MTADKSAAGQPIISLRNVDLRFGEGSFENEVFSGVNLDVFPGESVVLVGPSGLGKTSLLRLMAGLEIPTGGEVLWSGRTVESIPKQERLQHQRRIGMLFQRNALFDSMSVFDNVAFPILETTSLPEDEVHARVERYLASVGLMESAELFPNQISGGMQKRLGIARALALEPNIILYDDPTAGLDPITSRRIAQLIVELRDKFKATIVCVTNDMNRAYQLGGRIVFVFKKEIVETEGKTSAFQSDDLRIQQFIHGGAEGPLTQ